MRESLYIWEHYIPRTTDPYLSRFAQADTIVPGGVQGYDRYAYVNNLPVRYNDPSGHANECSETVGGACVFNKTSPGLNSRKTLEEDNDDQQSDSPLIIRLPNNTVAIIMPPGSKSTLQRPNWSRRLGIGFGIGGFLFDIGEIATIFDLLPGDEDAAALADIGVTYLSSAFGGDSYFFEKPHSSLPYMLTINQDVIFTTGDAGAAGAAKIIGSAAAGPSGYLAGVGSDVLTTGASLVYDGNRVFGELKNYVSLGVAVTSTDQINSGDTLILMWLR